MTSRRRIVLGVDSSTQSVKVEARDLDTGAVVATASARHPATTPPVSEQEPAAWWSALASAIDLLSEYQMRLAAQDTYGVVVVLQHQEVVPSRHRHDPVHGAGRAPHVHRNYRLGPRTT